MSPKISYIHQAERTQKECSASHQTTDNVRQDLVNGIQIMWVLGQFWLNKAGQHSQKSV